MDCFSSLRRDRGATLVFVLIVLVVLIAMAALAIDIGQLYVARQRAQNVCDYAALAGAPFLTGTADCTTPNGQAASNASKIASNNNELVPKWLVYATGSETPGVQVTFPSGTLADDAGRSYTVELGQAIRTSGYVKVNYGFARIFGLTTRNVSATSTVVMQEAKNFCSDLFVPLSVSSHTILGYDTWPAITFGGEVHLKVDTWQNNFLGAGNFGPLDMAGNGGSGYRDLLAGKGGVTCMSSDPSDWIYTLPGNKVGPTYQGLKDRLKSETDPRFTNDATAWNNWVAAYNSSTGMFPATKRIAIVPIVNYNTTPVNGKKQVQLIGMAGFFIESAENGKDIYGRFIQGIVFGENVKWVFPTGGSAPPSGQIMLTVRLVS